MLDWTRTDHYLGYKKCLKTIIIEEFIYLTPSKELNKIILFKDFGKISSSI